MKNSSLFALLLLFVTQLMGQQQPSNFIKPNDFIN